MKKFLSLFMAILMVAAFVPMTVQEAAAAYTATPGWGKGADNKYHITSPQDLVAFANAGSLSGQTVVLDKNIVFNDATAQAMQANTSGGWHVWTPKSSFSGTFDGQGHSIKGLFYNNSETTDVGFIKELYGTVKNVYFLETYFSGNECVGVVSSRASLNSRYEYIYANGIVKGVNHIGGIAGSQNGQDATFVSCWFDGEAKATASYASGILGNQQSKRATFTDCLNTGRVVCNSDNKSGISNAVYAGSITATRCVNAGFIVKADGTQPNGSAITVTHGTGSTFEGDGETLYKTATELLANCTFIQCYGVSGLSAFSCPGDVRYADTTNNSVIHTPSAAGYPESLKTAITFISSLADLEGKAASHAAWGTNWAYNSHEDGIYVPKYFKDYERTPNYYVGTAAQLSAWTSTDSVESKDPYYAKTVVLTADVANAGAWTPKAVSFKGTFDGRGHKITITSATQGLFRTITDATVKNLSISANINTALTEVGGFAGVALGKSTFINCRTEGETAITSSQYNVAAFVGSGNVAAVVTFKNCWFAGSVESTGTGAGSNAGRYVSGFLANNQSGAVVFENCLATGSVSSAYANTGDMTTHPVVAQFAGAVYGGKITCTNCLAAGSVNLIEERKNETGAFTYYTNYSTYARTHANYTSRYSYTNCYAVKGSSVYLDGYADLNKTSDPGHVEWVSEDDLVSVITNNTAFDGSWDWKYEEGKFIPVPESFADEPVLKIGTYAELVAWASNATTYAGQTVVLTADIVANAGTAAQHASSGASNVWPVKTTFNGNFDGQGHTISGLYFNSGSEKGFIKNLYGTVRNVYFKDTYFSGTNRIGGVVAYARDGALIENVYVDGVIKTSSNNCGGIAAGMYPLTARTTEAAFKACWFNGEVSCSGGYAAGILANQESQRAIFTDCLNTGTVYAPSSNTAGISGGVYNGTITATRCVNAGKVNGYDASYGHPIFRTLRSGAVATLTACYAVSGTYGNKLVSDNAGGESYTATLDGNTATNEITNNIASLAAILSSYSGTFGSTWGWYDGTTKAVPKYFSNYVSTSSTPVKSGKKFAGWYNSSGTPYSSIAGVSNAVAKFVSRDVMNVKAQTSAPENGTYKIRFMSTIDNCTDYTNVGFVINANGRDRTLTMTRVYKYVWAAGKQYSPSTVSGCGDSYYATFAVLKGIPAGTKAVITVKPFWTTKDGTTVYGDVKTYYYDTSNAINDMLSVVVD